MKTLPKWPVCSGCKLRWTDTGKQLTKLEIVSPHQYGGMCKKCKGERVNERNEVIPLEAT